MRAAFRWGFGLALLCASAACLEADAGERPRSKRGSSPVRFGGQGDQGPPSWSDPTGLVWAYAWGFDEAGGPRTLVGGVDLPRTSGAAPPLVAAPPAITPTGLGLEASMLDLDGTQDYSVDIAALTALGPVHMRLVCLPELGANNGLFVVGQNGDPDGAWLRLSFGAAAPGRPLSRSYNDAGLLIIQNLIQLTDGDPRVIDFVTWDDSPTTFRADLLINGETRTGGSTAHTWTGPSVGRVSLLGFRGLVAFVGVRRLAPTLTNHQAAVTAAIP